jgi:hypothetical protein
MLTVANRLMAVGQRDFTFVGYRNWTASNGPRPWSLTNAGTVVGGDPILDGDLILLYVARADTGGHSCSTPSGFTLLQSGVGNGSTRDVSGFLFYQVVSGTPANSISISFGTTDTAASQAGIMMVFRNFDPSTPIKQSVDATATSGGLPNPPSVSTNALGRYVAFGSQPANGGFGDPHTSSDLDPFYTITATDSTDCVVSAGWSESTNDPAQFGGNSSSSAGWHAATVRLHALS